MVTSQIDHSGAVEISRGYLRCSADDVRNRGYTQERAISLIAQYYVLELRRVKRLIFGQPIRLLSVEITDIVGHFERHLIGQAEYLAARRAIAEDRIARLHAGEHIEYVREKTANMTTRIPAKHGPRQRLTG